MTEEPPSEDRRRNRLRDIVDVAVEQAFIAIDIPASVASASVDLIVDGLKPLAAPGAEQVAEIVKLSIETAAHGAREAAELSGEIAESIVEGISDLNP